MKNQPTPTFRCAIVASIAALVLPPQSAVAQMQEQGRIEGVVRDAGSGDPLAGSFVSVVGTGTMAVTHGDGTFRLAGIAEGVHSIRVDRLGYRGATVAVTVEEEAAVVTIDLISSPIALQGMVVTATISERDAAKALRPVSVMAGDELQRRMGGTVATTLASVPGMGAVTMGPAVSQPVIRGLSGDRVLLLEDGTRVGDVTSSGTDHTTGLNPSSARRIEVVRGAGALLYGGNALGGVVNVIRDEIPAAAPRHTTGSAALQSRTVTGAFGGGATAVFGLAERLPLRVEVAGRTSGDLRTPTATLANTGSDVLSGAVGSSWVADWGHLGGSFRVYRNDYGIPGGFTGGHEEGVRIEMERFASKFRTIVREPFGFFRDVRFDATHTWYEHRELEPPDILGTLYRRQAASGDALGRHGQWGPFAAGAVGARLSWEDFGYGGSTHTPDTRRGKAALYLLEEMDLGALRLEWGLRYDWTGADPLREDPNSDIGEIRDRGFHGVSGSLGALYAAGPGLSLGASLARTFRAPDITELYSEGPHLAAYSFEVGNPSLEGETGRGLDVFLRYESDRLRGDLTGFYNDIRNYIYGEDTGRLSRVLLPIYQFQGNDAVFRGFEAALNADLGRGLAFEAAAAAVRGSIRDGGDPLPLVPPLKGHMALKYERPLWFVRGEAEMAARQDRIGEFETPTDGYRVLNLSAGVRITAGGRLNLLAASLDNATNTEYRNHLSRVKEIMPEAGRGLTLSWRVLY